MKLLFVASHIEPYNHYLVYANRLKSLLRKYGLHEDAILIREIPEWLASYFTHNWDDGMGYELLGESGLIPG